MMETKIYFDNTNLAIRHDLAIELRVDELAELRPATAIELVDAPGGAAPAIEGSTLRCYEPGRYRFRVVNAFGMQDLHVLCVASEVFDFVRSQVRTLGHGDSSGMPPSDAKVRSVVKSLVNNAPWFDGEVASLTTGEPSRGLNQFGC
jgi:hypothetical protein